ncbi:MAG TPA: right-handed parallel beta-helix repeat-containing protein [Stellaceae bacterium]|nr:right-handed parallel beta-helix repeat-containing protein [Stellaceae bacterium]
MVVAASRRRAFSAARRIRCSLPLCAAVLAVVTFTVPAASAGVTYNIGPGKAYTLPSQVANKVKDGDRVEIAPGTYFDCAIWRANDLIIEGTGPGVVLTDKTCAGKGIMVIDGNNVTVRNLTLQRARVPDRNGAGIREEGRDLTVDGVKFINDEDGILANPSPQSTIIVRNSDFERNGLDRCVTWCSHGIYINAAKLLRVEHSRFYETRQGHSIKSRAAHTEVIDCDIEDGPNGTSSYLIDVPNGGSLLVRGNTLEKGPKAENHITAIAIGEEGVTHPTDQILVENNTFRNDGSYPTALLWNVTATPAILKGNKLIGRITPLKGDGRVE